MDGKERVLVWISGGVASAVAAMLAQKKYAGILPIEYVYCDTGTEDDDNNRFIDDVAEWLGINVTTIKSKKYTDTFDVYRKKKYIVGIRGAPCTVELKKVPRREYENLATDIQIFGYTFDELRRFNRFKDNNPLVTAEAPLIDAEIDRDSAFQVLNNAGIQRPLTYELGFRSANCMKSGCVKCGMGYWNHFRKMFPDRFNKMAELEREIGATILTRAVDGKSQRVYLDELHPMAGNYDTEPAYQCSLFCQDISKED